MLALVFGYFSETAKTAKTAKKNCWLIYLSSPVACLNIFFAVFEVFAVQFCWVALFEIVYTIHKFDQVKFNKLLALVFLYFSETAKTAKTAKKNWWLIYLSSPVACRNIFFAVFEVFAVQFCWVALFEIVCTIHKFDQIRFNKLLALVFLYFSETAKAAKTAKKNCWLIYLSSPVACLNIYFAVFEVFAVQFCWVALFEIREAAAVN